MKRTMFLLAGILLLATTGFAWFRASPNYRAGPDALTAGGGTAASPSHVAPHQALGEGAGYSASASYRNQTGANPSAPDGLPPSRVAGWQAY